MSETIEPTVVRRVERVDLDMLAAWLIQRITERHTEATPREIMGWLVGCVSSNEYLFVRSDRAIALTQIVRKPLERQPEAWEIFAFCRAEEDEHELVDLYPRMVSWAANLNASKLWLGVWSDITAKRSSGKVGRHLQSKSMHHILLGRIY